MRSSSCPLSCGHPRTTSPATPIITLAIPAGSRPVFSCRQFGSLPTVFASYASQLKSLSVSNSHSNLVASSVGYAVLSSHFITRDGWLVVGLSRRWRFPEKAVDSACRNVRFQVFRNVRNKIGAERRNRTFSVHSQQATRAMQVFLPFGLEFPPGSAGTLFRTKHMPQN